MVTQEFAKKISKIENLYSDVVAFDEFLNVIHNQHPREDMKDLYGEDLNFSFYAARTKLAWPRKVKGGGDVAHHLVTVVTAYYSFPSKFTDDRYYEWISNFLKIKDPVVVFTDKQNAKKIRMLAKPKQNIRIQVKPLTSTHISSLFPRSMWEQQLQKDPERALHKSFFLYWVWHEKSAFLKEVSLSNPFNSTAFAWVDIGAFRTDFFINKQVFSRRTSRFLSSSVRLCCSI